MSTHENPKQNHAGHPVIKVRIQAVRPSWLVVKMEDGTKGIIPKREWSPDRRIQPNLPEFIEGQRFEAVLLPGKIKSGYAHLSLKELHNPWAEITHQFKIGDVVQGEVVNLRNIAAFAQIEPGITAIIWARDIPLLPNQIPSEVLSPGDRVFGVIVELDLEKKRMAISINDWLRGLHEPAAGPKEYLERIFLPGLDNLKEETAETIRPVTEASLSHEYRVPPLGQVRKILVIDDNDEDRERLMFILRKRFSAELLDAGSGKRGLELLSSVEDIDLVVLDIELNHDEYGPEIAADILEEFPGMHIIFTSRNPFKGTEISKLEFENGRTFPFVSKPVPLPGLRIDESLAETVSLLEEGTVYRTQSIVARNQDTFIDQLEMRTFLKKSLRDSLDDILYQLCKTTFIENAVLLELEPKRKEFQLTAAYPPEREDLFRRCLDGLYYSQVREVIEDEEILYASKLSKEERQKRFRNFFTYLRFQSCYGMPVRLQGYPLRHGLFILDDTPDFTWETILRIRTAANYAAIALERELMLRMMQQYEDRYFKGQLFGTFIHELRNNLQAMHTHLATNQLFLEQKNYDALPETVRDLEGSMLQTEALIDAYSRLARHELEPVNVNDVVRKVERQLNYYAREQNQIQILLDLDEQLPEILANPLHLEQIISNIALNAIQHVFIQTEQLQQLNLKQEYQSPLQSQRVILIHTCMCQEGKRCRIAVLDSGPGVPYDQQEKIFQAGVSSRREGHGLGLFISRNLAEAMQGRLFLLESIRFAGSSFVVSFPIHP